jgi:hypothetical protein
MLKVTFSSLKIRSPSPEFNIHEKSDKMKIFLAENLLCFQIIPLIISTIVIIFIFLCILFLIWYIKNIPKVYQNATNIPFLKFPYHGLSK